jgi:hypothetical protein
MRQATTFRARVLGFLAVTALAVAGCGDGFQVLRPGDVSGIYRLESVNGAPVPNTGLGAVLAGEIVLGADGQAVRRMRYQLSGVAAEREFVASGTFTVRRDTVRFALIEDPARPELVWRPAARLERGALTLRYPNAADGPDNVELFRKLP